MCPFQGQEGGWPLPDEHVMSTASAISVVNNLNMAASFIIATFISRFFIPFL